MSKTTAKPITCKAAVVFNSGEPPVVEEIQVDPPKTNEVRIKMLYSSLCHTDLLCCKGFPLPLFPRVPGHEGVGAIESVGENVRNLEEGDIVMPLYLGECGECGNCVAGKSNICQKYPWSFDGLMADGRSRMSIGGKPVYQLLSCSTWSEYTVVDVNYVIKLHPSLPLPHASLLSCGFTSGFGPAWKLVEEGSVVCVLGLGAVGLGAVQGARLRRASTIIGIDINEKRCEIGKAFGLTEFINPNNSDKSVSECIKEATAGLGVDFVFECTGVPALLGEAVEASNVGHGTVAMIGVGLQPKVEIGVLSLITGRTVKGFSFGGFKPRTDLPAIVNKCVAKEIELDGILTHEVQLREIGKAFQYMKDPDCVKVLIKF